MLKSLKVLALLAVVGFASPASADETQDKLKALVGAKLQAIAADAALVSAVKAQNEKHAAFDAAKIDELDKSWRAEAEKGGGSMTNEMLGNSLSAYLKKTQANSGGLFAEIFVMDNKGLNVGMSALTSDYMQGDEDKWQKSFGAGAEGVFIDSVKEDASTGAFVAQVSLTVVDEAKQPIGAITYSIDVSKL